MSAWYILSSMGFYPVSPGQNIYAIGSPLFSESILHLENGKSFVIKGKNASRRNFYIQSARLNGKDYPNTFLKHQDIMGGGELVFSMAATPGKSWGEKPEVRPYSENGKSVCMLPYLRSGEELFQGSTRLELGCESGGSVVRYTLDGAEPTERSDIYRSPIMVSKTTRLKMKGFQPNSLPSEMVEFTIRKAEFSDAVLITDLIPGLRYDYYERFFVSAKDLDLVKPVSTGTTSDFNMRMARVPTYFGINFTGYILAPADGLYTFYLQSNDGSYLFLDGKELIENDGNHGGVEEPGTIGLKAGYHSIGVKYMQFGGGKTLRVSWSGPGFAKKEITKNELFRMK
jgi:hypothetical protein